jgi:protein-disulfide isomerase
MEDKTTLKKVTLWQAITAMLGILLIISIFTKGFIGCPTTGAAVALPEEGRQEQIEEPKEVLKTETVPRTEVSLDDDPIKGNKNAPVTIVEFSDYQCPFCGRYFSQTYPQILKQYVNTGKVKYVFRDFPLSFHKNAQKAAEAAECAHEQDKYWEMHDKLFENQRNLDIASLKQYAADINLDTKKFNSCLDSGKYASEVQKDFNEGSRYGVSGTPTFFINGIKLVGAQPLSAFKQVIDAELTK